MVTLAQDPNEDARKGRIAERMREMRERTLALVADVSEDDLARIHDVAVGPPNWDLGHIAEFEESWVVHGRHGAVEWQRHYDPTYDADKAPRPRRERLRLPERARLLQRMAEGRERVLQELAKTDLDGENPYTRDGFIHEMTIQHEAQHQENILVALQAIPGRYPPRLRVPKPSVQDKPSGMALVEGGPVTIGAALAPGVYDNEGPTRLADVASFRIGRGLVTNAEYLRFVEDGGYESPEHWSEDGWYMRSVHEWRAPKYWQQDAQGNWLVREYDVVMPLPRDQPVVHVSWYEAEAFAAWAGKRLPTEVEWEKAATWDPRTQTKWLFPWGDEPWTPERANLDQRLFGVAPVGAYPEGASAYGCHQMLGDVWEWTSSPFQPYPGFEVFPYAGYSVPFMNVGFKVLRGGSWATRHHVARGTFRNWHHPYHQHVFAGFRLAEDA